GEPPPPDFRNPRSYEDLAHQQTSPPRINHAPRLPDTSQIDGFANGAQDSSPYGTSNNPGIIGTDGRTNDALPRPPDPPKPAPRSVETDNKPLRVASIVLQGKVIERRVPI